MSELCNDRERRMLLFGADPCNGKQEECGHLVRFGRQTYCGYTPGRCDLHQTIRLQAGCLGCDRYTKELSSVVCESCLRNENRVHRTFGCGL